MGNNSKRVLLLKLTLKKVESENRFGRIIKHKRNGILNGQSYTLYPNETLQSAGHYLEGVAEGLFMNWYESGERIPLLITRKDWVQLLLSGLKMQLKPQKMERDILLSLKEVRIL